MRHSPEQLWFYSRDLCLSPVSSSALFLKPTDPISLDSNDVTLFDWIWHRGPFSISVMEIKIVQNRQLCWGLLKNKRLPSAVVSSLAHWHEPHHLVLIAEACGWSVVLDIRPPVRKIVLLLGKTTWSWEMCQSHLNIDNVFSKNNSKHGWCHSSRALVGRFFFQKSLGRTTGWQEGSLAYSTPWHPVCLK